ncbi:MAG: hypothetical protein U0637_06455 [Phycisphaerales bacterium]
MATKRLHGVNRKLFLSSVIYIVTLVAVLALFAAAPEDVDGERISRVIVICSGGYAVLAPTAIVGVYEVSQPEARMSVKRGLITVGLWTLCHCISCVCILAVFLAIMTNGML